MTALSDFQRFIADAEHGAQYAKWAQANPGEVSRWTTFKNAVLAGGSPAAQTMSTDHGRELVDVAVMTEHYRALEAPPTPPPPPPPAMNLSVAFTLPATISAPVDWTAIVTGGIPTHVEFYVDGVAHTDEFAAPYTFNGDGGKFDPATVTNGTHTFEVSAYDAAGKSYSRIQTVTVNAPAPTPPPPSSSKPFILFRYSDSFAMGDPSTYGKHYGVVVVGYGDDNKASVVSPAMLLAYRTSTDIPGGATTAALSGGGMTLAEARQGGWLFKNAAGAEIFDSKWGVYYGNLSPAFTAKWCANVAARLASMPGIAGLFFDNITGRRGDFSGGLDQEQTYKTDRAFADAMLNHIRAARAALPGMYLLLNAGNGPTSDRVAWWKELMAAGADGLLWETYLGSAEADACIRAAAAAGKDPWAVSFVDPTSAQAKSLAAQFKAAAGGRGGFGLNLGGTDPWNTNWAG